MNDVTPEQRAAWDRMNNYLSRRPEPVMNHDWGLIALLLPEALTNPMLALPTETGWYADSAGDPWQLTNDGTWLLGHTPLNSPEDFAPFTRLIPERPQVTPEQVEEALHEAHVSGFIGNRWKEVFVLNLLKILQESQGA